MKYPNKVSSFEVGEIVAFKTDKDDLESSPKYCVVEKTTDKVIISDHGKLIEVYPIELLTAQEVLDYIPKNYLGLP
ncbi:hypothetical protein FACS1894109_14840 [Spirochaetia bacterium]|nr:hypothetical protein FACS1894109_14840 [Spirochaetia bacterium]